MAGGAGVLPTVLAAPNGFDGGVGALVVAIVMPAVAGVLAKPPKRDKRLGTPLPEPLSPVLVDSFRTPNTE